MIMGKNRIVVLTLITVLVAAALSFALVSPSINDRFSSCASSDPPLDLDIPPLPAALSKGDKAPEFTATDIDGNSISLSDLQGRVVVLNFMATWCQSCVWEAGRLVEVYDNYQEQDVVMLSIDIEPDGSLENLRDFISEHCTDWSFILDDGDLMALYEVVNLPTTYVVDKEGYVAYGHVGLIEVQGISSTLDKLLV